MPDQTPPDAVPIPTLGLRPKQAAQAIGIGVRKLWELTADQTSGIPYVKLGRVVIYPTRELADWLAEQVKGARP